MRHRWVIVLASVATLVSIVPLGMKANKNFLPEEDESQFGITCGRPRASASRRRASSPAAWRPTSRSSPSVSYAVTTIGDDPQKTQNLSTIYVKLVPPTERKRTQQELTMVAREAHAEVRRAAQAARSGRDGPRLLRRRPRYPPCMFQIRARSEEARGVHDR
jgi:multidrug efflux pump subunit AcrB